LVRYGWELTVRLSHRVRDSTANHWVKSGEWPVMEGMFLKKSVADFRRHFFPINQNHGFPSII